MEIVIWNTRLEKFIDSLDKDSVLRVLKTINLLKKFGNKISMPDSKSLGNGLFELRIVGRSNIRILYVFHNNKSYLIHGFIKKIWKINIRDIKYARNTQKEIKLLA